MLQRLFGERSWKTANCRTSLGTIDAWGPVSVRSRSDSGLNGLDLALRMWRGVLKWNHSENLTSSVGRLGSRAMTWFQNVFRRHVLLPASRLSAHILSYLIGAEWKTNFALFLLTVLAACLRKGAKLRSTLVWRSSKGSVGPAGKMSSGKKSLTSVFDHHNFVNATISKTFNSKTPFSQSSTAQ